MNAVRQFFVHGNGAWVASLTAVICFIAGIAVTAHVGYTVRSEIMSQNKREAVASLSEVRAKLEGEFGRTVAYGIGLRANVVESANEPFDARRYDAVAADLIDGNPVIRSIGLAPDNILQAVYPLQPNQSAIGLNYRTNASQWPAIKKAMLSREIVIAGPLELVQGGRALLVRIPVFPPSQPGQPMAERPYWGCAVSCGRSGRLDASCRYCGHGQATSDRHHRQGRFHARTSAYIRQFWPDGY